MFQQYSVLQRLVPALDLALSLRVVRCATNMAHALIAKPLSKLVGDVTRAIVREQSRFLYNLSLVATECLKGELQGLCNIITGHAGAQLPSNHVAGEVIQYRG